tara:strand:+ start:398 stop:616 length:219 start_codon:yes stop_codon:yes gene_type:complete
MTDTEVQDTLLSDSEIATKLIAEALRIYLPRYVDAKLLPRHKAIGQELQSKYEEKYCKILSKKNLAGVGYAE